MSTKPHLGNKAFLITTYKTPENREEGEYHLKELESLCSTYGLVAVGKDLCHLRKIEAKGFLGSGKLQELLIRINSLEPDLIVFDDEISPNQQRNLEVFFKRPVIDRSELIIEVFAQRAQTREAKLQIELAQLNYQLPRLKRLWTHLSRQTGGGSSGGGGYLRGVGESQIELDRRAIRRRISSLEKEMEKVRKQRSVQRQRRRRFGPPSCAIVGYTNAGKSTLLHAFTRSGGLIEDKLFATLDTMTRKFILPNKQEVLLIDTVGFIRKIPHHLVAAFKSTLEEIVYTDLLLHLIDVSDPQAELQAEVGIEVIRSLEALNQTRIVVLNKVDLCKNKDILYRMRIKYSKTVAVSAVTGEGMDDLLELMMQSISNLRKVVSLRIPQSHYSLVNELLREGRVIQSVYEDNDIILRIEIPSYLESKVRIFAYDVI